MSIHPSTMRWSAFAPVMAAALAMSQCGGAASPAVPTSTTPAVSTVAMAATSLSTGANAQGTVTLTIPALTGGASVTLVSSNPAVATVQTPLTIQAGAVTATFTVAAVAAGTATIVASLNGTSTPSAMLTVTARVAALSTLSLSASTVVGGNAVTGTVTLTAAAPAGGALVSISSGDPATVPASVLVPAGSVSATFLISTRAVGLTTATTISGAYGGGVASTVLSVTRAVATASFGVSGPSLSETCEMANDGHTVDCTFNGSTSTAPGRIVAWDWSYGAAATFQQTTSGPILTMPTVDCSVMPAPPLPAGEPWFTMTVTLKIHDDLGNVSAEVANRGVRLLPQGVCGF